MSSARDLRIHPSAIVEEGVQIGSRTAVWDNAHLRAPSTIGCDCIIGEKTYIAYGVNIGDRVKLNAFVYVCTQTTLEDGVMVGAGTIFTNDRFPRATSPDLQRLNASEPDEDTLSTRVGAGATLGSGCRIGPGLNIGRFAMVGMGSVVTRDLPPFALALGHPARQTAWVCRCGHPFFRIDETTPIPASEIPCPSCALPYRIDDSGQVVELDPPKEGTGG